MLRNLIVLPDGTEVYSGTGMSNTVKTATHVACVNDADELSLGSVCANALEVTIFTPGGNVALTAGDEVTLYKVDDTGTWTKKGIFRLEKPTRPTTHTMKLTGYDRITKLDKDLSAWLNGLTGWPYTLKTFAGMVCEACGLTLTDKDIPNADYPVTKFTRSGVTGRSLMQWIGEICCRFCRANADGEIEFAWYTPSGITIAPTGDRYYFQGALSYETYQVAPIDAVQLQLADSDCGALWPEVEEGANSYIISGNPILLASVTDATQTCLEVIKEELSGVTYTPCKLSIPACLDIDAGNTVDIIDKNGAQITAYVMTKTTTGQKDILECTGSARRDSATAVNNRSQSAVAAAAAKNAFGGLTQQQVFDKLTDNGAVQGIYVQDGKWYINAEYAEIINLSAETMTAGKLSSKDGTSYFDLDNNKIATGDIEATGGTIGGWNIAKNGLWQAAEDGQIRLLPFGGLSSEYTVGPLSTTDWVIFSGPNNTKVGTFGVTRSGALYATDAYLSGTVDATKGSIGGWTIGNNKLTGADGNGYEVNIMPSGVVCFVKTTSGYAAYSVSWDQIVKAVLEL